MKKYSILLILNLVIFSSCSAQQTKDSQIVLGEFGAIEGFITGLENEPLANVSISIYENLNLIQTTQTDKDGHYLVDSLVPKVYTLEAHENEYAYHIERNIEVTKGKTNQLGIFQLSGPIIEEDLKPVIYLYPESTIDISVKLNYQGSITHSYPKYTENGWKVTANPEGELIDEKGKEFYALFWEGKPNKKTVPTEGFVIPGEQTVTFLEETLATLGLNRREANEFIMFWMPQMEDNAYNLIYFEGKEYSKRAELVISPSPETVVRVMMHTKPLSQRIEIPLQDLTPLKMERKGYTVVEWGGSLLETDVDL